MSPQRSPVGRNPFSEIVASTHPLLLDLAQEMEKSDKRRDPQWRKYGLKVIELVREWETILDEQEENERLDAAARTPKKKAKGTGLVICWRRRRVVGWRRRRVRGLGRRVGSGGMLMCPVEMKGMYYIA
jgi:hypothetical protein